MSDTIALSNNQYDMLAFLLHTTEENPLDLSTGFNLGDEAHRTGLYREYIELAQTGLVQNTRENTHKHWITPKGVMALRSFTR